MPPPAPIPCTFTVAIVPVEHKPAADLVLSMIFGDPAGTEPFSQGTNSTGDPEDPIECYHLGLRTDAAWEAALTDAITTPPDVPGGYPWNGITAQDALDAVAAVKLGQVTTHDGTSPSQPAAKALALQHYGQVEIEEE